MNDMVDKIPSTSYEMVELYAKNEEIEMTSPTIKNLRTTFKKCLKQDLRNCHKHWRGYAVPCTKKLDQTHENIRSFQLLN